MQRKAESCLQAMHLEDRVQPAVFNICSRAAKSSRIAIDRDDRVLQRVNQLAAVKHVGLFIEVDERLRPVAGNAVFDKGGGVAAWEGCNKKEIEARFLGHALKAALELDLEIALAGGGRKRKSVIVCAVTHCALTSRHLLCPQPRAPAQLSHRQAIHGAGNSKRKPRSPASV